MIASHHRLICTNDGRSNSSVATRHPRSAQPTVNETKPALFSAARNNYVARHGPEKSIQSRDANGVVSAWNTRAADDPDGGGDPP
jgi:hypothetical protein